VVGPAPLDRQGRVATRPPAQTVTMAPEGIEAPCKRECFLAAWYAPRYAPCGSSEQFCVVELCLVAEDVAIYVCGNGEVSLPHELADSRPRDSAKMRRLIRLWCRSCGLNSGMPAARHPRAIAVRSASAPEPANRRACRSRSSRGPSWRPSASARVGSSSTQSGLRVFVVAARSLTRLRGSW
jgi:hypothetical protein